MAIGAVSLAGLGCLPISKVNSSRDDDGDLPLFQNLRAVSVSRMLYPFSHANEVELSLLAADSCDFKLHQGFSSISACLTNDFLKNELDKTETDWLLTPPDSPLFHCLDFENKGGNSLKRMPGTSKSPMSRMSKKACPGGRVTASGGAMIRLWKNDKKKNTAKRTRKNFKLLAKGQINNLGTP